MFSLLKGENSKYIYNRLIKQLVYVLIRNVYHGLSDYISLFFYFILVSKRFPIHVKLRFYTYFSRNA